MTTKPKPRKRAAKAAPFKPAPAGTPREVSEIERLFTRYKWLEADRDYQAEMASTEEESERLMCVPHRELNSIVSQLAELRPNTSVKLSCFLNLRRRKRIAQINWIGRFLRMFWKAYLK